MATRTIPRLDPALIRLADARRRRQQGLARAVRDQLRRLWRFVDAANPAGSWALVAPRAVAVMTAAQSAAAQDPDAYVTTALAAQGATPDPAGLVNPLAFVGFAADGRSLDSLLGYPAFEVTAFVDQGMSAANALAIGQRHLDRIAVTETTDAARTPVSVAISNDRTAYGWVRMLNLPSCSRCVILAGRWYRYNQGFQRHPGCDCQMMPSAEVIEPPSPRAIFDAMSDEELKAAGWNKSDVRAIREDGADIYQVTNAHRDLRSVTVGGQQLQATGHGGRRKRPVRLTPASLYSEAKRLNWSRDELLRALKLHGYIL